MGCACSKTTEIETAAAKDGDGQQDPSQERASPTPGAETPPQPAAGFRHTSDLRVGVLEGKDTSVTLLNDYVVLGSLGKGAYGSVKLCFSMTDNTLYALKVLQRAQLKRQMLGPRGGCKASQGAIDALRREVDVMRSMNHPNLIKIFEVIEAETKVVLVQEYAEAGPLVQPDQPMSEPLAQFYFRQIVAGLECLHSQNVVHGDMKPDNVLLSGSGLVKLADFGQAHFFDLGVDVFEKTLGTPAFMAPEVRSGNAYHGMPADMWALGVTLYVILFGDLPFKGETLPDLYEAIQTHEVQYPPGIPISDDLHSVLDGLLNKDPLKRPTSAELLHHPWVVEDEQWLEGRAEVVAELERMDDAPSMETWIRELGEEALLQQESDPESREMPLVQEVCNAVLGQRIVTGEQPLTVTYLMDAIAESAAVPFGSGMAASEGTVHSSKASAAGKPPAAQLQQQQQPQQQQPQQLLQDSGSEETAAALLQQRRQVQLTGSGVPVDEDGLLAPAANGGVAAQLRGMPGVETGQQLQEDQQQQQQEQEAAEGLQHAVEELSAEHWDSAAAAAAAAAAEASTRSSGAALEGAGAGMARARATFAAGEQQEEQEQQPELRELQQEEQQPELRELQQEEQQPEQAKVQREEQQGGAEADPVGAEQVAAALNRLLNNIGGELANLRGGIANLGGELAVAGKQLVPPRLAASLAGQGAADSQGGDPGHQQEQQGEEADLKRAGGRQARLRRPPHEPVAAEQRMEAEQQQQSLQQLSLQSQRASLAASGGRQASLPFPSPFESGMFDPTPLSHTASLSPGGVAAGGAGAAPSPGHGAVPSGRGLPAAAAAASPAALLSAGSASRPFRSAAPSLLPPPAAAGFTAPSRRAGAVAGVPVLSTCDVWAGFRQKLEDNEVEGVRFVTLTPGAAIEVDKARGNVCLLIESGAVDVRYVAVLPIHKLSKHRRRQEQRYCSSRQDGGSASGYDDASSSGSSSDSREDDGVGAGQVGSSEEDEEEDERRLERRDSIARDEEAQAVKGSRSSKIRAGQLEPSPSLKFTVDRVLQRAQLILESAANSAETNLLTGVRGPNDFVGIQYLLDPSQHQRLSERWRAVLVARSEVHGVLLTRSALELLLKHYPLSQVYLRITLCKGRAELLQLETLENIASCMRPPAAARRGKGAAGGREGRLLPGRVGTLGDALGGAIGGAVGGLGGPSGGATLRLSSRLDLFKAVSFARRLAAEVAEQVVK